LPFTETIRPAIQVTPRPSPTPSESLIQTAAVLPKPLESYQEFTLYAVLKRWMNIIING